VLAIDRMDFAGDRIFITGATNTPQPAPVAPGISGIEEDHFAWKASGEWRFEHGDAFSSNDGIAGLSLVEVPQAFLCEFTFRCIDPPRDKSSFSFKLGTERNSVSLTFHPNLNSVQIELPEDASGASSIVKLPDGFDWTADHLVRADVDHGRLKVRIDAAALDLKTRVSAPFDSLMFTSDEQSIAVCAFGLTLGFEDLFDDPEPIVENDWRISGDPEVTVEPGEIFIDAPTECVLHKGPSATSLELTVNFRLVESLAESASYGIALYREDAKSFRFAVEPATSRLMVSDGSSHDLGGEFPFDKYHQLRILKTGKLGLCYFDDAFVGEFEIGDAPSTPAIFCSGVRIGIEMVRATVI